MTAFGKLADKMLAQFAPKATAAACGGCTYSGPYSGPCQGGYGYYQCCPNPANGCKKNCGFVCSI